MGKIIIPVHIKHSLENLPYKSVKCVEWCSGFTNCALCAVHSAENFKKWKAQQEAK